MRGRLPVRFRWLADRAEASVIEACYEWGQGVILILADSTDPWGMALARQLTLYGEPYVLQDPGQMCSPIIYQTADRVQHVSGVYRGMSCLFSEDVAVSGWLAELNSLSCPVVNRLTPGGVSSCPTGSPVWKAIVSAHGFQAPCFHTAANRNEALACLNLWGGSVYVKPAGGVVHSGMALSEEDATAHLEGLMPDRPVLLAPVSAGLLVSFFVVGEHVAATVVRSTTRSQPLMRLAPLGPSLLQRCSDLVLSVGLVHAECLLCLSADGQITCLDVVASPSYWTCPWEAQQQVVSRLARYLAGRESLTDVTRVVNGAQKGSSRD